MTGCGIAGVVWEHISRWYKVPPIFGFSVRDLLELHKTTKLGVVGKEAFHGIIIIACWRLWKARNEKVFDGKEVNLEEIIGDIKALGFLWFKSKHKSLGFVRNRNSINQSINQSRVASAKAKEIVSTNPVVVFSKSYCPYCVSVKKLLTEAGSSFKAIELDLESDGSELQAALHEWTGQRTVPNVFIGGKHIGGCDSTTAMHQSGKLIPALTEAKAIATKS